jgi:hypothetical protein
MQNIASERPQGETKQRFGLKLFHLSARLIFGLVFICSFISSSLNMFWTFSLRTEKLGIRNISVLCKDCDDHWAWLDYANGGIKVSTIMSRVIW